LINIVYFDLYDIDGDGKISKKDLGNFLEILNTWDETDSNKIPSSMKDNDLDDYKESMVNLLCLEMISDKKRNYIDYREFSDLMWHTDIDKTCVIYLEKE
jgi:Ca2+-binding EF-hand superfamily protein